METVPTEMIQETWERLTDSTPDEVQMLLNQMADEQPALFGFLMAEEDDETNEDERGHLLLLGVLIWQCFSAMPSPVRQVSEEELDAAQEANFKVLEDLGEDSEMGFLQSVEQMVAGYHQMPLLGAVLADLMAEDADEPELAGEDIGMSLIHLKSIIDCLDRASD